LDLRGERSDAFVAPFLLLLDGAVKELLNVRLILRGLPMWAEITGKLGNTPRTILKTKRERRVPGSSEAQPCVGLVAAPEKDPQDTERTPGVPRGRGRLLATRGATGDNGLGARQTKKKVAKGRRPAESRQARPWH